MPDQHASTSFALVTDLAAPAMPSRPVRRRARRPGVARAALALALGLVIVGGNALTAWTARERALADAERDLRHVSFALAYRTDLALQTVEAVGAALAESLRAAGIAEPAELPGWAASAPVEAILREAAELLGRPDAIRLLDADGRPVTAGEAPAAPHPEPAPPQGEGARPLAIAAAAGQPGLELVRRLTGPSGEPLGAAVGLVDLGHLARLQADLPFAGSSLHLHRADGTPLLRYPPAAGEAEAPASLSAGHASAVYPMLARAEAPLPAVLAAWRAQTAATAGSTVLALLLMASAVLASTRRARAMAAAEGERLRLEAEKARLEATVTEERLRHRRALAAQETEFLATVESMSQGVMQFGPHERLGLANCRVAEIVGVPLEALRAGATLPQLILAARRAEQPGAALLERMLALVTRREPGSFLHEKEGGGAVLVVHKPLRNGGWLATFDDAAPHQTAERHIRHLASHDPLTGLLNRAALGERLAAAVAAAAAGGGRLAVLHLNLDRFRSVNEALGDRVGDALLAAVAGRILRQVRTRRGDLVARLGADEFVVLTAPAFGEGDGAAEAAAIAARLVAALGKPFEVEGYRILAGTSVGIALFPPGGTTAEELLRNAALALRAAKEAGGGRHLLFGSEMSVAAHARRLLELDFRLALTAGDARDLELHYQPVVEVLGRRACALEAQPCWHHPVHGPVPAETVLALAAELGLSVQFGELILRHACAEVARWSDTLRVAVDLSAPQLRDPDLPDRVAAALAGAGLPARRLEIEVAEDVLLAAGEAGPATLHRLRALGVRVTLDGFGAVASALRHLRAFPFDKVKIAPSFVRELGGRGDGAQILAALGALCGRLGIPIAAEEVETEVQLRLLAAQRCVQAQGPLFGRPVPAAGVPAALRRVEEAALAAPLAGQG